MPRAELKISIPYSGGRGSSAPQTARHHAIITTSRAWVPRFNNHRQLGSRFHDPSDQRSALYTSKQRVAICTISFICEQCHTATIFQNGSCKHANAHFDVQMNSWQWHYIFRPSWGLLQHAKSGPGIIKPRRYFTDAEDKVSGKMLFENQTQCSSWVCRKSSVQCRSIVITMPPWTPVGEQATGPVCADCCKVSLGVSFVLAIMQYSITVPYLLCAYLKEKEFSGLFVYIITSCQLQLHAFNELRRNRW
jgi:hypothetical protein